MDFLQKVHVWRKRKETKSASRVSGIRERASNSTGGLLSVNGALRHPLSHAGKKLLFPEGKASAEVRMEP
jgi:hypothetical protein